MGWLRNRCALPHNAWLTFRLPAAHPRRRSCRSVTANRHNNFLLLMQRTDVTSAGQITRGALDEERTSPWIYNLVTVAVCRWAWNGCTQLHVGRDGSPKAYHLGKQSTEFARQCYCNHWVSLLLWVDLTVLHISVCHVRCKMRCKAVNIKCLDKHRTVLTCEEWLYDSSTVLH